MTPEKLHRLRAVVEAALERPRESRREYIADACRDEPALAAAAEQLLGAEETFDGFLSLPNGPAVDQTFAEIAAGEPIGRHLGPYRLMHVLACGGMGTVYLAVRADDAYEKQVAVKLIHRGMDSRSALRRFQQERQLLASLDHPNVARLLDGGTTDDGRPFIVMEYIDGVPIDRYCDERELTVDERLEIFESVCAAVHYAHQNLIVHRDLKPNNVLVSADGVPKLVDFGISKLLPNAGGEAAAGPRTVTYARAMTPQYASPEQIRGERITTAADTYSLGVMLYELLSGHRPYQLGDLVGYERERAVCETEPSRPSTIVGRLHPRHQRLR